MQSLRQPAAGDTHYGNLREGLGEELAGLDLVLQRTGSLQYMRLVQFTSSKQMRGYIGLKKVPLRNSGMQ